MQRLLGYANAALLLVLFVAPIPVIIGLVPNFVAVPESGRLLWVVAVIVYAIAAAVLVLSMRMTRQNPPPGFVLPSAGKAFWSSVVILALYVPVVLMTIRGALPAYATYIWDAPQVMTFTVKDPALSSSGRSGCDGGVSVEAQMFFSRICGVPQDLRSQMTRGSRIEVTGPGHGLGLRVETVRLLP